MASRDRSASLIRFQLTTVLKPALKGKRFVLNLCWEALQWQRRDFFVRPVLLFMEKFFVLKRLKESFILRLATGSAS